MTSGVTTSPDQKAIYDNIADTTALFDAWRVIRKKGKAGGIDGVSIAFFEKDLTANINQLSAKLQQRTYVPEPYQRLYVEKPHSPGERRPLSLTTIGDKVVQQALRKALEPIFDAEFLDVSYAYRPGKGPVKAVKRISHIINTQKIKWAACADIDRCFDSLDHDILLQAFRSRLDEPDIVKLIAMWLKIGAVTPKGVYADTPFGVAQGGIISPLLSNIYLHQLDLYMRRKECGYVRYADNFILLGANKMQIEEQFTAVLEYLRTYLKLQVNHQNNYICSLTRGFVFMGIYFKAARRYMDRDRIDRAFTKIEFLVDRHLNRDTSHFLKKLQESVQGFENYYAQLVECKNLYLRLNRHLCKYVAQGIATKSLNIKKKPVGNDIRSMFAEIRLYGTAQPTDRSRWIEELCRLAGRIYDSKKASESLESKKGGSPSQAEKAAAKAVRKKKARYRKQENISRELVIETPGSFIGKTAKKLVVKKQGAKVLDFPLEKLETVVIAARGVTLSSDIVWHCSRRQIPLFFSDRVGNVWAVLQRPMEGDADIGLLQLQALQEGSIAIDLAAMFVRGKIRNQINLLKYYARHRKEGSSYHNALGEALQCMEGAIDQLECLQAPGENNDYGALRNRLMGHEANAARNYWQIIRILLIDDVPDFPGRRRQGAKDLVNSLLNYGYGFLYRQVWRTVVGAGLNPKISFLHAPQGDKPALVFDLVEEFRPQAVDRVVFSMLTKNERLRIEKKSGNIDNASRHKLIEALLERQATAMTYRGERVLLKNIIQNQIRLLCRHLRGEKEYRHFTAYY